MVNFEYGKIYKLYSKQQNITYIGSTAMYYLSQRLATHKGSYKSYLNNKSGYVTSFKILECEDYKIELIENYPCANVDQLETRERYYIENNECVNKNIPTRTIAEYNKEYSTKNKDKIKENDKKYRTNNIDKIKAKASNVIVCECGCQFRRDYLAKHKKTKKHLDFVQNKDTIDKVVCKCGCQVGRKYDLAKHTKTQKHIRLMELVQNS